MGEDFDWRIEDSNRQTLPTGRKSTLPGALRFWLIGLIVLLSVGGTWFLIQHNHDTALEATQSSIQAALDLARDACRRGDGTQYFALQAREPEWQAAQMRPDLFAASCAGPTVTHVQPFGSDHMANIAWVDEGRVWQRLAFFTQTPFNMIHIPVPADYWGRSNTYQTDWGTLITTEADHDLVVEISRHVSELVAATCSSTKCLPRHRPFTLVIRPDYQQTAAPNTLFVASPRLLALSEDGAPGTLFWEELDHTVVAQITPGTILFAVPPWLNQVINFEREAALFTQQNPFITIEIVETETPSEDPAADLADYDGAAFTPSPEMVAAGLVRDLSDYATTDPTFDDSDFYEQVWQGAWWRDRLWLMPQAGQMRLLFYDCRACDEGQIETPSLSWIWSEMDRDISVIMAAEPMGTANSASTWTGDWALLDTTQDTLLAFAYSQQTACEGIVPARCRRSLGEEDVTAALGWYWNMVRSGMMPDTAALVEAERTSILVNWQSTDRRAAIWVDEPVHYEHQLQYWRVGVVPFPGTGRFDGNTPFWVHGSFISQTSQRPLDVWRWLVFLSNRPLVGALRYVPARPSVAQQMKYWSTLPRPLQEAMRTAFPFARPVSFEDRRQFSREQIDLVTAQGMAPEKAAMQNTPLVWFDRSTPLSNK